MSHKFVKCKKSFKDVKRVTESHHRDKCMPRNIHQRFLRTGVIDHVSKLPAMFADYSNIPDFRQAMTIMSSAEQEFAALSSDIRKYFDNDMRKYVAAFSDDTKVDDLRKLGLVKLAAVVKPDLADQVGKLVETLSASSEPASS